MASVAPLSVALLLEAATDDILMRRIGGGHIFIHRALLEQLADECAGADA